MLKPQSDHDPCDPQGILSIEDKSYAPLPALQTPYTLDFFQILQHPSSYLVPTQGPLSPLLCAVDN